MNILITSIGAKVPLIKSLQNARDKFNEKIIIYGGDIDNNCIGQFFVDEFYLMDRTDDINILNFIKECKRKNIKHIVPTSDNDVLFFSNAKKEFLKHNIFIFSANKEIVNLCFDKYEFSNSMKKSFIIPTYLHIEDVDTPKLVVKERFGSGSKMIAINVDKKEAKKFAKTLDEPIFQPCIKGEEFSIDSYVSLSGVCIASIVRSRDVINNGESQVTTYVEDRYLENLVSSFVEEFKILGHSVIQVIKDQDDYHLIECNTRFGGASTLSYKMGLESFYWFLQEINHSKIEFSLNKKHLKQVRFAEDRYIEC